jgi:hypothetical protein
MTRTLNKYTYMCWFGWQAIAASVGVVDVVNIIDVVDVVNALRINLVFNRAIPVGGGALAVLVRLRYVRARAI